MGILETLFRKSTGKKGQDAAQRHPREETVTDIDGHVYHTITIGNQVWTTENLRVTRYNDGSPIPLIAGRVGWTRVVVGRGRHDAYCWHDDETMARYGALYNWWAVQSGKIAPKGWHVPSDDEWTELERFLIHQGYNYDGTREGNKIAKSLAATWGWKRSRFKGSIGWHMKRNNLSGFSALPGGHRDHAGYFHDKQGGSNANGWWSDTGFDRTAACRTMGVSENQLYRYDRHKICGYAIRLVKD